LWPQVGQFFSDFEIIVENFSSQSEATIPGRRTCDFLDDTGQLNYTKKQEIFLQGYKNIVTSPNSSRPDFYKFVTLFIYFLFAFVVSDTYSVELLVPEYFIFGTLLLQIYLVLLLCIVYGNRMSFFLEL